MVIAFFKAWNFAHGRNLRETSFLFLPYKVPLDAARTFVTLDASYFTTSVFTTSWYKNTRFIYIVSKVPPLDLETIWKVTLRGEEEKKNMGYDMEIR